MLAKLPIVCIVRNPTAAPSAYQATPWSIGLKAISQLAHHAHHLRLP